jgi:hypothetical protein
VRLLIILFFIPFVELKDLRKQFQEARDELEKVKTSIIEKDKDASRTNDMIEDWKKQIADAEGKYQ